ncbi:MULTISPECIES: SDR family oxidoreductase [unclassified Streptomyces]|uniref:SDR family oxidoreductase n=1 Tax=unclassified Streptomyces TaxID=2593676 RepID=UPI000DADE84A|nr:MULTISPECIES: SDR family oxidoreductase [unclassified Streptomyces]PZT73803.1 NAD-dependent epimerase [Streptomyces sp. AC1-42T]PZT83200.1 NAD-dependent epimerase [Streptomyces sp. AC1-42W]
MGTIAVTGAASGMGASIASLLTEQGHRVIGVDLRGTDVEADLGTPEGRAAAAVEVTRLTGGRLDGFVPFAGISGGAGRPASLLVSVNYFGAIGLLEQLRPSLAAAGESSVVLASSNSITTQPGWNPKLAEACLAGGEEAARALADSLTDDGGVLTYPATKAAVAYYTRTRAADYIKDGIRLNAIAPGFIDTPMTQAGRKDPQIAAGIETFLASIPAGRAGTPEEVAELVLFLLSAKSAYCVGTVMYSDGGLDAKLRGLDWPKVWTPQA